MTAACGMIAPTRAAGGPGPMFFQVTMLRIRALKLLASIGVSPGVGDMAALAQMARELKGMGGNAHDVALGYIVAQRAPVQPAQIEPLIDAAALKASRVNARGYAEKLKTKRRRGEG